MYVCGSKNNDILCKINDIVKVGFMKGFTF